MKITVFNPQTGGQFTAGNAQEIKTVVNANDDLITNLSNQVTTVNGQITTLTTNISTINDQIDDLEELIGSGGEVDLSGILADITALETQLGTLSGTVTNLQTQLGTATGNITTVTTNLNTTISDLEDLTLDVESLETRINALEDAPEVTITQMTPAESINNSTIRFYGDSLTNGLGINTYPSKVGALSGYQALNFGIGGETSTQIRTRLVADTARQNMPTVIWAGRNNFQSPTTVKADIAAMVAALGHNRYLVLGVTNATQSDEYVGQPYHTTISQLNTDLAAIYGTRFIDIRSILVNAGTNTGQDLIDKNNDAIPLSLRTDTIHLNRLGNNVVADAVYAKIDLLRGGVENKVVGKDALGAFRQSSKSQLQLDEGGKVMIGGVQALFFPIGNDINFHNSLVVGDGGNLLNPNTGSANTFVGFGPGKAATSANQNTGMGDSSLLALTTGTMNSAYGQHTLPKITGQTSNTAMGWAAGFNSTGNYNVFFGVGAGQSATTGNGNVLIGFQAGDNITTGSGNIVIGNNINALTATGSNTMNIAGVLFGQGLTGNESGIAGTLAIGKAATTTASLSLLAGTTATAPLNIPDGVAPTAPVNGDVWFVGDVMYRRIAGVTKSLTFA